VGFKKKKGSLGAVLPSSVAACGWIVRHNISHEIDHDPAGGSRSRRVFNVKRTSSQSPLTWFM
jgi:hypothetical protein